jgi:hypothetical protein
MNQLRISSDAAKAKTGEGWDEWFAVVDESWAAAMERLNARLSS